jgi:hypothetical protein
MRWQVFITNMEARTAIRWALPAAFNCYITEQQLLDTTIEEDAQLLTGKNGPSLR